MSVGERVKRLRLDKGMRQVEAAEAFGVAVSTWQRWEGGAPIPSDVLVKMVDRFEVDASELLLGRKSGGDNTIDRSLLFDVMTAFFSIISEQKLDVQFNKLPDAIIMLYDYYEAKGGGQRAMERVLRLVVNEQGKSNQARHGEDVFSKKTG